MYRCSYESELADYVKLISKMKYRGMIYQKPGLPRKVRLSSYYQYVNRKLVNGKGTQCILCHQILKQKSQTSTTKACIICQVPLCSSTSYKFKCLEDSCEWRWHNIENLSILPLPNKSPKKSNMSTVIQGANTLLDFASSARRMLTTEKEKGNRTVQYGPRRQLKRTRNHPSHSFQSVYETEAKAVSTLKRKGDSVGRLSDNMRSIKRSRVQPEYKRLPSRKLCSSNQGKTGKIPKNKRPLRPRK